MNQKIKILYFISLIFVLLTSCSLKDEIDPVTGKKKIYENNPQKKAEAYRDAGGGIFNTSRSKSENSFEFSTSNVLWRATLKSLESIPLGNIDYAGGMIITDWYSPSESFSNDSIKIKVRFLTNKLSASSLQVTAHKKTCNENGACKVVLMPSEFNNKIQDKILAQAQSIKLAEDKSKQK